jgi:serine/threonine protein kinase
VSPERYQQIKAIFYSALEAPPSERAAFLNEACGADAELRREVESLIASHDDAGDFIEAPAARSITQPEAEDATASVVGERIGPYQVIRQLGQGGMGVVCLAVRADDQYRKRVAIKLVRRGMNTDFIIRRFRHERQILASLDHPNIARMLDGGATAEGLPYFVMEYIEGLPINEYCDRHHLATVERLNLFRTICAAVQYAHQNLVVHRDLKPGNILITADGTVKLLDFGIAKLLNPELAGEAPDPTLTGMRLMTPGYASPEQARGQAVTTASDVYSLGVILYELLTGHRPYHVSSLPPHEAMRVICEQEPVRPSTVVTRVEVVTGNDGAMKASITPEAVSRARNEQPEKLRRRLSGDLDNIVLMAMRKEPQRRYTSAGELAEDIRRHLEGLPVIAREDTFGYRAGKFIRRHTAGVAAAGLVALALLAGLITTLWQARVARAERARAEQRFNDVRRLANSFLFELHEAIEKLPGSTPARALLVRRALEYLDSLAGEAASDPSLQRELATAYEKVGDIQGNPYSANLGEIDGALQSYRKSLQIREALLKSSSDQTQGRRELAASHRRIGDILTQKNDLTGALQNYRQALQHIESLSASSDPQLRREQAASYEALGDALRFAGDQAASLENHRRSLQIVEALAAQEPLSLAIRRQLAIQLGKVGSRLSATGASAEGLELTRKALTIFAELAAAQPDNAQARRELAVAHNNLGDLFYDNGDVKSELENYRQALRLREELAAADPTNRQLRRDLATSQGNVGYALAQTGDEAGMVEHYRKSVTIFEQLSAANPGDALMMRDLAACYDFYGESWKLLASQPSVSVSQRLARWQQARDWLERSLRLTVQMRERGMLPGQDASLVENLTRLVAECDREIAKLKGGATGR